MRAALLAIVLAACSDDAPSGDIHAVGDCDQSTWFATADRCEAICRVKPSGATAGTMCQGKTATMPPINVSCGAGYYELDGHNGCCVASVPGHIGTALFVECE